MLPRLTNAILENFIVVLLAIFMLLMPYCLYQSSYILVLVCVLSVVYRLFNRNTMMLCSPCCQQMIWLFVPMLTIFALHLIGMLYSPLPPKESWKSTEKVLSFLAFPTIFLLLGTNFFTPKRLRALVATFCALCLWIVVVYIVGFCRAVLTHPELRVIYEQHQWKDMLNTFLTNPTHYTNYSKFFIIHHTIQVWYMLTAMSVVVYTWVVYPQWYKLWYAKIPAVLLLILYAGVGVILAMSKMGWLMFGVWILLVLYFLWRRKCYGVAIGGSVLMLSMTVFLFVRMTTLSDLADKTYRIFRGHIIEKKSQEEVESDGSVTPRLIIWEKAVNGIKDKPLIGWGTAGEKAVIEEFNGNPHNQWLLYGLRFGILGILALVWLWWNAFRLAYRKASYLLFLFLFVAFGFMLTDRMLEYQPAVTFYGLFYGLFAVHAFNSSKSL